MPLPTPGTTVPISSGALSLTQLHMVSASVGWALATPPQGSGLGHLVRTTDGGSHWNGVGLPSDINTPNIEAVDFHDDQHAWVLVILGAESTSSHESAVVASTGDGGNHWTTTPRFAIDGHGTALQFIDAVHGWVFATPGAGGAIGAGDTTLYRTADGGQHWQVSKPPSQIRQNNGIAGRLPEACPMGGPVGRPVFTDAATGWLGAFCDHPFFFKTGDGGLSWTMQPLPPFPGPADAPGTLHSVDSFQRITASDFIVVHHRGFTTGGNALQEAAIYLTHDAGASWTPYRLPYPELAAKFLDPLHGWMIGAGPGGDIERRSLYATADGGRSWRLLDGPAAYYARDLNFVDTMTGFIAVPAVHDSAPELLRTTNGGTSWGGVQTVIS
ncbi:MAG TPA: hypothetical protein VE951_07685 [Candidatus Angelobacter sp.]|nr:hypothetical protein [Candidatus Angelobacter sp.]